LTVSSYYGAENKVQDEIDEENVIVTQGAIAANHLAFYSLVGPGDHVICHYPTYQQLFATPRSLGADVDLWEASPQLNWIPSYEELCGLIKPNTKLIVLKCVVCSLGSAHLTQVVTQTTPPVPCFLPICSNG
jgi:aspartate/methionine/tyrosine aminotransferase